jgi:hypothetical protein
MNQLNKTFNKPVENIKKRVNHHNKFKEELLHHDENVKPPLPKDKKSGDCAPKNFNKPQNWDDLMAKTMTAN